MGCLAYAYSRCKQLPFWPALMAGPRRCTCIRNSVIPGYSERKSRPPSISTVCTFSRTGGQQADEALEIGRCGDDLFQFEYPRRNDTFKPSWRRPISLPRLVGRRRGLRLASLSHVRNVYRALLICAERPARNFNRCRRYCVFRQEAALWCTQCELEIVVRASR